MYVLAFILFGLNIISILLVIVALLVTTSICRRSSGQMRSSSITASPTSTLAGTVAGSITMQRLTCMVWPRSGGPGVCAGEMVLTLLRLIMPGLCATSDTAPRAMLLLLLDFFLLNPCNFFSSYLLTMLPVCPILNN